MASPPPLVSIIYLTKNGGEDFRRSLEAAQAQRTDFTFEIMVIDSGSTDGTVALAQSKGVRVMPIHPEHFNYGETKNLGAREALGSILVFLSQDNIPASDRWLASIVKRFQNGNYVVQGPAISERDGYYWWARGGFFYTRETRRWLREHGIGLSSCNLAVRKDTLLTTPFRAVPMNEDKVLQQDLRAIGIRAVEAPDALVYHTHTYGPRDLSKRLENEGLGWRYAGASYTLWDMLLDTASPYMWRRVLAALVRGRIRDPHEILFPILRPLMIYKGIHYTRAYRWERELR